MKRLAVLGLVITLASALAGAGLAQDGPGAGGGGAIRQACAADIARVCPDAQPGPGRRQCVMAHRDQLSDACKAAIADAMARRRAAQPPAAPQN
jgi:hypothetical protein